ncbi:hypothetical protein K1719_003594 [Acacia pycnantha]|nr:hypothetical protein K1719_003594 [Acacia pycnantha]
MDPVDLKSWIFEVDCRHQSIILVVASVTRSCRNMFLDHPEDKDDGQRMDPRSSFKAFLEVLILRDSFKDAEQNNSKAVVHSQLHNLELQAVDELSSVAREMVGLIETATGPIFAVNVDGCINGWNAKAAKLTGLAVDEAMGKFLIHDLVYKESEETVDKLISRALRGEEDNNVEVKMRTYGLNMARKQFILW